jgi:hypothetical protein
VLLLWLGPWGLSVVGYPIERIPDRRQKTIENPFSEIVFYCNFTENTFKGVQVPAETIVDERLIHEIELIDRKEKLPVRHRVLAHKIKKKREEERTSEEETYLDLYQERIVSKKRRISYEEEELTIEAVVAQEMSKGLTVVRLGYETLSKSLNSTVEEQGDYVSKLHERLVKLEEVESKNRERVRLLEDENFKLKQEAAKHESIAYKYLEMIAALGATGAAAALPVLLSKLGVIPPPQVQATINTIVQQTVKKE